MIALDQSLEMQVGSNQNLTYSLIMISHLVKTFDLFLN
jgi:hypothetical protein